MSGTLQISNVLTSTGKIINLDTLEEEVANKLPKSGGVLTGDLRIERTDNNSAIEIGRRDGVASQPLIDFHSGVTSVDYDSRIIANGGNGTNAGGTLTYQAAVHNFIGTPTSNSFSTTNSANTNASFSLSYLNNVPRIRYGGTGAGSSAGFQIQGPSDLVKFSISDSGSAWIPNSIALGESDGVSRTPYIDFNTGSTVIDYDARIMAAGGNGSNGGGRLIYTANEYHKFMGPIVPNDGLDYQNASGTILSFSGTAAITRHSGFNSKSMGIGCDDTLFLGAGESRSILATNITDGRETVEIAGEGGVNIRVPTNNWDLWANQKVHSFTSSGLVVDGTVTADNFIGNISTSTGASSSSFWTIGGTSENQIGVKYDGMGDVYLYNNSNGFGVYSTGIGPAFNYTRATDSFRFYGLSDTALKTTASVTGTGAVDLIYCNMADNDLFRIRAGGTASNAGFVEIATADDGTEPIYVRQYTGVFATLTRSLTLLDSVGDTVIPGTLKSTSTNGGVELSGNNTGIYPGNGDGASFTLNNLKLQSWYGIGFGPTISGQPVPLGEYSHYFNTRNGDFSVQGNIKFNDKTAIGGTNDSWLRFNPTSSFTSGIYCGSSIVRTDGEFQVGSNGASFRVTAGGTVTSNSSITAANGVLKSVAVLSGTIAHGGTIPLPSGFTEAQCEWVVSMNNSNSGQETWDLREGVTVNQYQELCYTNGRTVVCYSVVQEDATDSSEIHNGTANYIIIGVK